MRVLRLEVGPLETNAYLVLTGETASGLVIDPGAEGPRIAERCRREGMEPRYVVNTHGHMDHIGGNGALLEAFPEAELCIGQDDAPALTDPQANLSAAFGLPRRSPPPDRLLADGDTLEVGGLTFEVRKSPGHTTGGICLIALEVDPPQVFCGDLVFRGSVGRTDFPGGSRQQLVESVRRVVLSLPDEAVLWPGHGPETTVGWERRHNPFIG